MPRFIEDLAAATRRILTGCGAEDLAETVARELVAWLCRTYGGERIYIESAARHRLIERNERIRREFNGRNHNQLADRYRLSVRTIYRILGD